jgi:glyoxylase-like metal-dependent hydrolase (beta-lactamase superfamily II)
VQPENVTEHVYRVIIGDASVYLIVSADELTLIDAGFPSTMPVLDAALRALGRRPEEITNVLVTHCHPDHAGGLAEIKQATGARVWMHPADAEMVRAGKAFRAWKTAPGEENEIFAREVVMNSPQTFEPAEVDEEVLSGSTVPVSGGIRAVGTPGHTAGHLMFIWPGDGGVLFVGDVATHRESLALAPIYEDLAQGERDVLALLELEFETACFTHGDPIVGGAALEFQKVWGEG